MRKFARRSLIQGLGLSALSFAIPWERQARAQAAGVPKRVVFFYGSGMLYDDWVPVGVGGAPAPTETAWDFGLLHQPLAPFKSKVLYMDGLGMVSEQLDRGAKGNAHVQGAKHALTGANSAGADLPGGVSIDQFIAQRLNSPAPVTRLPSLELQIAAWANASEQYSKAVASGPGQMLPGIWNPQLAYQRAFGDFVPPNQDSSLADALREQQAAVFGLAKEDFGRLTGRLGSADRERLQTHLDLLTDLEARLQVQDGGGVACTKPDAPSDLQDCDFRCYGRGPEQDARNWNLAADHHTRVAVAALACDITRVVFMDVGYGADLDYGYTNGMFGTSGMHDLIHRVNDRNGALWRDPDARQIVRNQCRLEAQKLANLLEQLEGVPQPDGTTLLDHTIVLWCGQIAYGSHDLSRLPWVLIGSGGGYFRTGRYLRFGDPESLSAYGERGVPHNNLFVSLANAMGIETDTFGNPACCTGPLDGLRA